MRKIGREKRRITCSVVRKPASRSGWYLRNVRGARNVANERKKTVKIALPSHTSGSSSIPE